MRFNVTIVILKHTFNINNVEAENEFSAELKVRKMIEKNFRVKHIHLAKPKADPTIQRIMDMFGMEP